MTALERMVAGVIAGDKDDSPRPKLLSLGRTLTGLELIPNQPRTFSKPLLAYNCMEGSQPTLRCLLLQFKLRDA